MGKKTGPLIGLGVGYLLIEGFSWLVGDYWSSSLTIIGVFVFVLYLFAMLLSDTLVRKKVPVKFFRYTFNTMYIAWLFPVVGLFVSMFTYFSLDEHNMKVNVAMAGMDSKKFRVLLKVCFVLSLVNLLVARLLRLL